MRATLSTITFGSKYVILYFVVLVLGLTQIVL